MREKLQPLAQKPSCRRITPASAGKTVTWKVKKLMTGDHPRECGKNSIILAITTTLAGSPPRVREKRIAQSKDYGASGITPASAGKTYTCNEHVKLNRDHPRECGKNANKRFENAQKAGSPPRVREKLIEINSLKKSFRITPASAGKTYQWTFCH